MGNALGAVYGAAHDLKRLPLLRVQQRFIVGNFDGSRFVPKMKPTSVLS